MPSPVPYPGTQAVSRAVAVLKAFSDSRPGWRLTELARTVRLHKTTVYRLLSALEREGMVTRTPGTEEYRLGPEAIALGARALRSNGVRAAARAALEALAERSGETATLEVLTGSDVLIVDEVQSRRLVGSSPEVGTRWPAHATSTGKVMLADLPEAEWRAALGPRPARVTPHTLASHAALRRELERVRRLGYATAVEELEAGYVALGAPVRNHEGRVIAGISVGGPSPRLTADRLAQLAPVVRDAASAVSAQLGWRPAAALRAEG